MNCEQWLNLSTKEKTQMIGKVVHCIQNDTKCFSMASTLLNYAELNNLFDDVIINPPREQTAENY